MKALKVGVDLDGVLADFWWKFTKTARDLYP